MLKEISTIKVQGANFASLTPFAIFEPRDGRDKQGNDIFKTVKGALLYGKNGTGKSTIAKAFRRAKGETQPAIKQISFFDKDGNPVVLSEEEKKHIFVFDEDFVNEKVKLKEDHLDTIIMLGQAADLAEKIEQAEKDRESAKTVFETKDAVLREYKDTSNPKAPTYRLWKVGNALRGDDAWAGRDRKINGGRQNTQVRDDTYKKFVDLEPTKTRSALIIEFEEQMKELENAKSGSKKIDTKVPVLPNSYNQYDDDDIIALHAKKIERPELSDREQYLMGLVESGKAGELSQKALFFRNSGVKECPYCFQSVSDEYRTYLVASIEKVLSKTVADHQKALEGCVYGDVIISLSDFSALQNCEACVTLIDKINAAIQTNKMRCPEFTDGIYKLLGWSKKCRYKVLGYQITFEGKVYYVFDLNVFQIFNEKPKKGEETENAEPVDTRTGYYPEDIANTFGVPLEQYRRETAVTDMDGYVTMAMFTGAEKNEADKAAEQDKTADS